MDEILWYRCFASNENRVENIFNPKNASDVLDKKRADYILDHVRINRLFIYKRLVYEKAGYVWDFRDTFSTAHYEFFLANLEKKLQNRCSKITFGDMYCNKVNAYAYPDETWGEFICVNVSIRFFAYFMLLALIEPLKFEIPIHIIRNSLRIGLRTWLGNEALDFEMDPRGKLPHNVETDIKGIVQLMLVFIAGHEFSHHILGHCNKNNLMSLTLWGNDAKNTQMVYNNSQKDEFAADLGSLQIPLYSEDNYERIYEAALLWFLILDMAEYAVSIINPSYYEGYQTHPSAIDRYNNILKNVKKTNKFSESAFKILLDREIELKELIKEDISNNYGEVYDDDLYGSAYLDVPNTKWRGKELKDHIDY